MRATVVVLIAAALGAVLAATLSAQVASRDAPPAVRQVSWEHLALQHKGQEVTGVPELSRKIEQLGREGWQLVDVEGLVRNGTTEQTIFYFKRRG